MKQDFNDVLIHQTKGIMLHSDLINLFALLKMKEERRFQYKQLHEEMDNYFCTVDMYINIFNETPSLPALTFDAGQRKFVGVNAPKNLAEKQEWYQKAINEWVEWEEETLKLYQKMAGYDVSDKFWNKLSKNVSFELQCAKKVQSKFILRTENLAVEHEEPKLATVTSARPVILNGVK